MDFIFSPLLWLLPLSAIPLIFHLINNRRFKVVDFSSIWLINYLKSKSIKKMNIINILLLIIRMLIIAFLILSMSRPTIKSAINISDPSSFLVTIIIDDTFSNMNAYKKEDRVENIKSIVLDISKYYDEKVHLEVLTVTKDLIYRGIAGNLDLADLDEIEYTLEAGNIADIMLKYSNEKYPEKFIGGNMFILSDMHKSFFENSIYKNNWWDITFINTAQAIKPPVIADMKLLSDLILPKTPFDISLDVYNPNNIEISNLDAVINIEGDTLRNKISIPPQSIKTVVFQEKDGIDLDLFDIKASLYDNSQQTDAIFSYVGNKYFLKKTLTPNLEVCFCGTDPEQEKYIKAALLTINKAINDKRSKARKDKDAFLIKSCSPYYRSLSDNDIVFFGNFDFVDKQDFQRYVKEGGHAILFPETEDSVYTLKQRSITKQNIYDKSMLIDIFGDFKSDTLFSVFRDSRLTLDNNAVILTKESSLWNRQYLDRGLIDMFGVSLSLSETDLSLKGSFIHLIHYLMLSHPIASDLENSYSEQNIESEEIYDASVNLSYLKTKYGEVDFIQSASNLEIIMDKKLKRTEIWHLFLAISMILIIIELVLVSALGRK